MSLATLKQVMEQARIEGTAIAGLVVLGWEDIGAFVAAGEALNAPIILQAGPGCRRHTPLSILGPMFRHYAETASVPVVCVTLIMAMSSMRCAEPLMLALPLL